MERNCSTSKITVGTSQQAETASSAVQNCSNIYNVVDDDQKKISSTQVVHKEGKAIAIDCRRNKNNIDEDSCILQILPPGYRFCPDDHQLIQSYLRRKVLNQELPLNRIHDVNLYDYNPYDLARYCEPWGDQVWYYFTPRDRKYRNGKRPKRSAGNGFYKATGADKNIVEAVEGVIGARKVLVFYKGKQNDPNAIKTNWIMHEYRIDGLDQKNTSTRTENNMRLDDWVLCKVYEKKRKTAGDDYSSNTNQNVDDGQAASQSPASTPSTQPAPEVVHSRDALLAGTPTSTTQWALTISQTTQLEYSQQEKFPAPAGINDILDPPTPINVSFPLNFPEEDYIDYMLADDMFCQSIDDLFNQCT